MNVRCFFGLHFWRVERDHFLREVFSQTPLDVPVDVRICERCGKQQFYHQWRVNASAKWVPINDDR